MRRAAELEQLQRSEEQRQRMEEQRQRVEQERRTREADERHRSDEARVLADAVQAEEAREAMRALEWSRPSTTKRRPRGRRSWSPPRFRIAQPTTTVARPIGPRRWLPIARGS